MNAETKLISAVCKNKDISVLLQENVDELFATHKDVWQGIKSYWYKYGSVPTSEVLQDKFRDFDYEEVSGDTKHYLDTLRDEYLKSKLRNLFINKSSALKERAGADVLQEMYAEISGLNKLAEVVRDVDITDFEQAEKHYETQAARSLAMGGSPGIPTGIACIDSAYSTGMAPGHLIVMIGWPGKGKTWMSAYLACQAWMQGFRPMIVSLEMSPETMRDRLYTIMGSGLFSNQELSRGMVNIDDFRAWGKKSLAGQNKFVVVSNEGEGNVTALTVQGKIDQHRPDMVICDYHQLFEDSRGSKSEVERNKNISRDFKLLAMRNKIPVIDITAATADDISDRKTAPILAQVAWSKSIEYDADMAMSVHRNEDTNIIEVTSCKNRFGPDFAFYLDWDIDRGVVKELTASDDR